tara:strand:+ start:1336 stop:2106 length:771 start_codon:yes stop_codon:yes gene_type:complete
MSCSYCYEYGHNRAGCSKRKERVAKERAAGQSNWLTREQDRKDRAKELRKQNGHTRRCSWCGETGHNRRGCPGMKAAKAAFASHNSAYRQLLYEDMREQGWGVGALVEVNPEFYDREAGKYVRQPITYLITSVNWSRLNWHSLYRGGRRDEVFRLDAVSVPSNHAKATLWSPHPGKEGITTIPESPYTYGDGGEEVIRLLSPVSASVFETMAPDADWFDGTMGLKEVFDKELSSWQAARWLDNTEELSSYEFLEKV